MMSKKFKFGVCVDEIPLAEVSSEWEYFEIPTALKVLPFDCEDNWNQIKKDYLDDARPTLTSSHFLQFNGLVACGPGCDREQQLFWAKRAFRRMNEVGVKIVGVYGGFFQHYEGWSEEDLLEQAIGFCNIIADEAEQYGMEIALEPMANPNTLWPSYKDGIDFVRKVNRKCIKLMADLNYFLALNEPLSDIKLAPELCINAHIQGDGGAQPNVGQREAILTELFTILRDIGYDKGVTAACPWVSTNGAEKADFLYETKVTFAYIDKIRSKVYGE